MDQAELEGYRPPTLAELQSRPEVAPEDLGSLNSEELAQHQFLLKMRELAKGLVSSEYWELVSLVLIQGLEDAKTTLESTSSDDRAIRVCQGEARAYRSAHNSILRLAREPEEEHGR